MKIPSLEELAENWKPAHTVAVASWVVVLVLGVALLFRNNVSTYPATEGLKVYAAENATFTYPDNWVINDCEVDHPFIELPGAIKAGYKGHKSYLLSMYGAGAYNCIKGRPERLDIYSEDMQASDNPCTPATSTEGEKLDNGLYLQLDEQDDKVVAVRIKQNSCFAPADTVVLEFAFTDPKAEPGDEAKFGAPSVDKKDFLESLQYKDIYDLAKSIRY